MSMLKFLCAASIGVVALAGCDDPELDKTRGGAVVGAAVGALSQIIAGNSPGSVVKGAVIGGAAGAVIGNILDRQEADLRRDIGDSGAIITNTGSELIVTLPESITFDTDSTYVRVSLHDDLVRLAANLQQYPDSTIDVIGHTDSVGDTSYNQNLSARRAESVGNILLDNGVAGNRIRAYGRGETSPVASNDSSIGRAQNRRVEIVIRPTA